ncbi:MAG: site-2 protease family protein [Clostridia bacterium]|nr:site-2 protease family protein [Clostridia bacterium]
MLLSSLLSALSGNFDLEELITELLLTLPVILLALSFHEAAHGFVAWKCGDNTAHAMGRITLNPFKHFDAIGFLCMMLIGYGWAKPVPINTRNFRNPKKGMALSALAGPMANLILGLISAVLFGFTYAWSWYLGAPGISSAFAVRCVELLVQLLSLSAVYNFLFMVFNLIPIPPFDGSRIFLAFLPPKQYFAIMRYEREIMIGLLLLLVVFSNVFGFSPFGWIAEKLTVSIASPIANFFYEHVFLEKLIAAL